MGTFVHMTWARWRKIVFQENVAFCLLVQTMFFCTASWAGYLLMVMSLCLMLLQVHFSDPVVRQALFADEPKMAKFLQRNPHLMSMLNALCGR